LAVYGGPICIGCGDTDVEVLQLDHIDGGGAKHRRLLKGGSNRVYQDLKDRGYPPGMRVLCANCNLRALKKLPFPNDRRETKPPAT